MKIIEKQLYAVIATILLIIYITLDLIFNSQLWDLSTDATIYMQSNTWWGEEFIFEFFTEIVYIAPLTGVYCFIFLNDKLNALIYVAIVAVSITINELLKSIYHQPRPYMAELEIEGLRCNSDYGKPSGHAQNSVVLYCMMPYLLFPELLNLSQSNRQNLDVVNPQRNSHTGYTIDSQPMLEQLKSVSKSCYIGKPQLSNDSQQTQSISHITLKILALILIVLSIIMTAWSRVFLGVHSIGQVMLGGIYGIYICTIYVLLIHEPLQRKIKLIINSFHTYDNEFAYLVPASSAIVIILLALDIGLLELNIHSFISKEQLTLWLYRINTCKQNHSSLDKDSPKLLYNASFVTTGLGAVVQGLIIGGFFIKGYYYEGYFKQEYSKLALKQRFARIGIFILSFVLLIPFIFVKSNNAFIQLFLQILPVAILFGIFINGLYPFLLRYFGVAVKGDMLSDIESPSKLESLGNADFSLEARALKNDQYKLSF